jgi:hypothetical protein
MSTHKVAVRYQNGKTDKFDLDPKGMSLEAMFQFVRSEVPTAKTILIRVK